MHFLFFWEGGVHALTRMRCVWRLCVDSMIGLAREVTVPLLLVVSVCLCACAFLVYFLCIFCVSVCALWSKVGV